MKERRILSLIICGALLFASVLAGGELGAKKNPKKPTSKNIASEKLSLEASSVLPEEGEHIFVLPSGESISSSGLDSFHSGADHSGETIETNALEDIIPFEEKAEAPIENVASILDRSGDYETEVKTEEFFASRYLALGSSFENDIEALFYSAAINCKDTIDISGYKISQSDANRDAIYDILQSFIDKYPELFNVKSMGLSYGSLLNRYTSINLSYTYSKSKFDSMMKVVDEEVEEHFGDIIDSTAYSDLQKALIVHDRLAFICEYDEENFNEWQNYKNLAYEAYKAGQMAKAEQYEALAIEAVPSESYNMYGTLALEISVCQGYSKTYQYILNKMGIEAHLCASDTLVHVWNIIEIEDELYHVDVTWDDPVHDIYGQALHNNFLLSSNEIANTHEATDFDTTPSDTSFDDAFWGDIESAFIPLSGEIYYIDSGYANGGYGAIYDWDGEKLHNINARWETSSGYYGKAFSRLAEYNNALYYNTSDTVYSLIPGSSPKRIYEPESAHIDDELIYGFKISDGKGIAQLKTDLYDESFIKETFLLSGEPEFSLNFHEKEAHLGDSFRLLVENFDPNGTSAKASDAEWSSSASSVASVDSSGLVSIKGYGLATITCRILDTAIHCYITVPAPGEKSFNETTVSLPSLPDKTFNGREHRPSFEIYYGSEKLTAGVDYKISYKNNINAGEASVILEGISPYAGRITLNFEILPLDISETLSKALDSFYSEKEFFYNGSAHTPFPELTIASEPFEENEDYLLSFENNINAGKATARGTGIGNFTGSAVSSFDILPLSIKYAKVTGVGDKSYTGKAITLSLIVSLDNKKLASGKDYIATYQNNREAGKATVLISGKGNYFGKITKYFYIHPAKVEGISQTSGKTTSIKLSWKRSASGTGYAILRATKKSGSYKTVALINSIKTTSHTDKNGIQPGKTYYYKVIAFKTVSGVKFTSVASAIVKMASAPKAPIISSCKNKKSKSAYLKWGKVSGAEGYVLYMSTKKSSGFKKIYSGSKNYFTKKALKKNKTYYFKVKAYRKGSKTIYSSYSAVKKLKIKK